MMRKALASLALVAASLLGPIVAQAQKPVTVAVAAGFSVPTSDLSDTHDAGWNASVALGFNMPVSNLGFRFEGFYNEFGGKTRGLVTQLDLRIAGGTADVTYALGGSTIRPYLIGGVGAYNSKFKGGSSDTNFGINAGGGFKFALGTLSTFAEARLHTFSSSGNSTQFVPITFGVEF